MTIATNRADRVLLYNISYSQFENILKDLGEHRGARVAYNNGTLEIMTPLPEHEYYKVTLQSSYFPQCDRRSPTQPRQHKKAK